MSQDLLSFHNEGHEPKKISALVRGFTKIGVALADVFKYESASLLSAKLSNEDTRERLRQHFLNAEEKLADTKQADICEIPASIGLPIVNKLLTLEQNKLSDAFVNLLAKGSTYSTLGMVHPAFIQTLENLSADEASILYHLKDGSNIPIIEISVSKYKKLIPPPEITNSNIPKTKEQIKAQIKYELQDILELEIEVDKNLSGLEHSINLTFKNNIDIYIENMTRLGLLKLTKNQYNKEDELVYEELEKIYMDRIDQIKETAKEFNNEDNDNWKLEFILRKGYLSFTEYGIAFLDACVRPIKIAEEG
ncbi:Abi-alpha family protein [Hymenobacter radiodurans]|uniref:Abi-alpha family protein n=1 Tax=Hymenobacter radiodurans TaxID=2496028 RepID=UPI0010591730|nr:Abi-alpha family protein [Hymenobacter radiodurans]